MSIPEVYTLQIKRVFLNFVQQYFATMADPRYRWNADQRATKIIIADKHGVDKPTNERRPLIILSRHSISPLNLTLKQRKTLDFRHGVESYADLLRGSITLNCLAKSGLVAENLAHTIISALMSYRDQLRGYNGIHDIVSIQIGEEVAVIADVDSVLTNVPVTVQYTKNIAWTPVPLLTSAGSLTLISGGVTIDTWYEGLDYEVYRNRITTYDVIPSGYSGLVSYLDAITLIGIDEYVSGIGHNGFRSHGVLQEFLTTSRIYAYYPAVHEIRFDYAVSGITYYYPTSGIVSASGIDYYYSGMITEPVYSGWMTVSGEYSGML